LSFVAAGAAPADLEVPFVFADPTDYPDPEPAVEIPQVTAEPPDATLAPDAAVVESGETLAAPVESGEQTRLPTEDEINADLARAFEKRMREMDEAIARLDYKIAQDAAAAAENAAPPAGAEPTSES